MYMYVECYNSNSIPLLFVHLPKNWNKQFFLNNSIVSEKVESEV